jgi:hypothetical protein
VLAASARPVLVASTAARTAKARIGPRVSSLPKLIVVPLALAHELAVPLADLGGAEVAAEVGDEALDEPQVLEAGDEQQPAV